VTFTTECEVELTVEVLDATRGARAHTTGPPDGWLPGEGDSVDLVVRLGDVDVTGALPADVLEELAADALERLEALADEPD
jgi:hypothetical protein